MMENVSEETFCKSRKNEGIIPDEIAETKFLKGYHEKTDQKKKLPHGSFNSSF
jgi:hypothetical protein